MKLCKGTYDLWVIGERFGLARLVVRLPLELHEHRDGFLQVLVAVLRRLKHDGKLREKR